MEKRKNDAERTSEDVAARNSEGKTDSQIAPLTEPHLRSPSEEKKEKESSEEERRNNTKHLRSLSAAETKMRQLNEERQSKVYKCILFCLTLFAVVSGGYYLYLHHFPYKVAETSQGEGGEEMLRRALKSLQESGDNRVLYKSLNRALFTGLSGVYFQTSRSALLPLLKPLESCCTIVKSVGDIVSIEALQQFIVAPLKTINREKKCVLYVVTLEHVTPPSTAHALKELLEENTLRSRRLLPSDVHALLLIQTEKSLAEVKEALPHRVVHLLRHINMPGEEEVGRQLLREKERDSLEDSKKSIIE